MDWSQALCAQLTIEEGQRIFYPLSEKGQLPRTAAWPKPDSHREARRMCPRCPLMAACLEGALEGDECTFRALSPEERAAFGGVRTKAARKREPYLTQREVIGRIVDSGYDLATVLDVLMRWDRRRHDEQHEVGPWDVQPGWSRRWGSATAETVAAALLSDSDH